ncbi:MAG TPA: cbb3-type cytochrome c oxidase subunit I [Burkholderiales bacterium]|nr:cbb3-type cytochrome c oxidase subunit I [Burkholderiales bacterium]
MTRDYCLPQPSGTPRRLTRAWLLLGVAALALSGLYSILIVLARTPGVHALLPAGDFFRTALVVHVDLSVLIWFLAFGGALWSLDSSERLPRLGWAALGLCALGTLAIATAPAAGSANPLLNNYVPVLRQPHFLAGLLALGGGFTLLVARSLLAAPPLANPLGGSDALRIGLRAAAATALLAVAGFAGSYFSIGARAEGEGYYEYLFWGGGHVLQFTHTVLMLACWLWLAEAGGAPARIAPRAAAWLFALAALPAAGAVPVYLAHEVLSVEHRVGFTALMKWGGLAAVPLGIAAASGLLSRRGGGASAPARSALAASVLLFAAGGVIGFLIHGVNVVIPAHYHGSIVGVTLAFMGLTYLLLPQLGYAPVAPRLANIQAWVYGGGQLLHILGLAWSGGYGVQRKTAGAAQGLERLPEIAGMALMGLGGLVAIIGGLLFIVVVLKSLWDARRGLSR